jgi:MarR family
MGTPDDCGGTWTLLTGHGHVLVEIARNPKSRIRDISAVVDLTERAVQAIVADLEAAGYLTRSRDGRRNIYTVNPDMLFRHQAQEGHRVGPFLALLAATGETVSQRDKQGRVSNSDIGVRGTSPRESRTTRS